MHDADTILLVQLLRDEPDYSVLANPALWKNAQSTAVRRKMAANIAYAVRNHASREQRSWCDRILVESWTRHDECMRHLDSVLEMAEKGGVAVLALKGPILGRRHFQPPFLRRPSGDIDLAVRNADLEEAMRVYSSHGFVAGCTATQARRTSHHLTMRCPARPRLELHVRLSHETRGIPVDMLFDRAVDYELPTGRVARILCPEDELLGLLLHLASDRFASFFHLYEFRRVWRAADSELRMRVIHSAVSHGFAAVLWLTDVAFRTYWSEPFLEGDHGVPETWLQSRLNAHLLHELEDNVLSSKARTPAMRVKGRLLDLQVTDTPADALRVVGLILRVAWNEFLARRWGTITLRDRPAVGAAIQAEMAETERAEDTPGETSTPRSASTS